MKVTRYFLSILLICSFLLTACQSPAAPVPENESEEQVEIPAPPEEPEPEEEPQVETSVDTQDEIQAEVGDEMAFLTCPTSGESLILGFDHAITIEQPDVNLTHILKEGFLTLSAGEADADGVVNLSSVGNPTLEYEMMGVMGPCSVAMAGEMQVSASGTCTDGVVYLRIVETWQSATGSMTCDDDVIPFNTPGPGSFVHEGPDGGGEIFYLVDSSEGYTVMRPFGEGSGYHSWTLYASQIELVPLVP